MPPGQDERRRRRDQRHHPHPHWSADGAAITYTGCRVDADGDVATQVTYLRVGGWRPA